MAILKFVDSIASSPTVRLDLNNGGPGGSGGRWIMTSETQFPPPPLRRSVSSSMLANGEYVGADAYGNRELILGLRLNTVSADTGAADLQLLQRELDRPTNLLMYQPHGATHPVFFRTYRSPVDRIRWDPHSKDFTVNILAEPFALGLREDIAAATVRTDPALTGGAFMDLTGIKGDVETPLLVEYSQTSPVASILPGFAVGVRSFRNGAWPTMYLQASNCSTAFDTTITADAAASGGSRATTTFAIQTGNVFRLSGEFPALTDPASAAEFGQYRVFARVRKTVGTDTISVSFRVGNGEIVTHATLRANSTDWHYVDLGLADSTGGFPTTAGYQTAPYRAENQPGIFYYAQRPAGSGSLYWDHFIYVPADECFGTWAGLGDPGTGAAYRGVVDGIQSSVFIATALNGATPGRYGLLPTGSGISGRLPVVRPGNSRLTLVETSRVNSGGVTEGHGLSAVYQFTVRYWPKYLLTRPLTT